MIVLNVGIWRWLKRTQDIGRKAMLSYVKTAVRENPALSAIALPIRPHCIFCLLFKKSILLIHSSCNKVASWHEANHSFIRESLHGRPVKKGLFP